MERKRGNMEVKGGDDSATDLSLKPIQWYYRALWRWSDFGSIETNRFLMALPE